MNLEELLEGWNQICEKFRVEHVLPGASAWSELSFELPWMTTQTHQMTHKTLLPESSSMNMAWQS